MMKKLLFSLLLFPSLAWATYIPVNGSSITVAPPNGTTLPVNATQTGTWNVGTVTAVTGITNALPTGTNNVGTVSGSSITIAPPNGTTLPVNATQTGTWNVGTVTAVTAISNALPTGTNNIGTVTGSTFTLQGSNGSGITSTSGALDINIKSGSIANTGFNVNNTPAVSQSGTWTVQPGNTANTTAWKVDGSAVTQPVSGTVTANIGTGTNQVNLTQISSTTVKTSGTAGEQLVSAEISASSNTVIVSSFGVIGIDGNSRPVGYNAQGSSVPVNIIETPDLSLLKWSTATITTDVTEHVFISSAGAGLFNNLCGCIVTNTSATNAQLTFRQTGPLAVNTNQILIGAPANSVPAGIWPGCTNPFYRSASNANITVQASGSLTSIEVRCEYYTSL